MQPLFEIDPYCLRVYVLKTHREKFSFLLGKVPLSVFIMRLAEDCLYSVKVSNNFACAFYFGDLYRGENNFSKVASQMSDQLYG